MCSIAYIELFYNGAEYRVSGSPGYVCSVDCAHVRVWSVAANLSQVSTGKEKFPSRVFEAAVNHRGMIVSATKGFYGIQQQSLGISHRQYLV